ncbi:MAG: cytochrome bd ubiquinol oxidase subunit [Desulfovibrionales bacterium]|jgi:cytochrome d ubiquinol oxidase subunit II|nr:cytochrome bd ubiquinol oxidase subunit [Desulfovibrionales bacterium]
MLETIWFILWGVLWAVYFMLDGFDLGMGMLMPFLAKNETEKRTLYNAAGPFWDGNEVWLIAAGGVTFAAFPTAYAVMFSGLYSALLLLLFALILRGVSFEFRSKVDSPAWRSVWDFCQVVGGFLPALLLGVAFANIFKGLPLDAQGVNQGGFFSLLNPYGLLGGVLFVLLFAVHGCLWLGIKSGGALQGRADRMAARLWPVLAVVVVLFLAYTSAATQLFGNYLNNPALFLILAGAVAGLVFQRSWMGTARRWAAWGASALMIVCVTMFGVIGLYPAIIPSSLDPGASLTIYNASSSPLTLKIMLGVALVFVPIVLLYQAWVYKTFSHRITDEDLRSEEAY